MRWQLVALTLILGAWNLTNAGSLGSSEAVPSNYVAEWLTSWPSALAFGDLHASYAGHYFKVDPSLEMVIEGEYPRCRYFSFVAHDIKNRAIATIHDSDILPDTGSVNPFQPGSDWNADYRRYTIIIRFSPPPPGSGPSVVRGVQSARGNVLYVGSQADGRANPAGLLVYRVYLPSKGYDFNGGVSMPKIYYRKVSDGTFVKPISKFKQKLILTRSLFYVLNRANKTGIWAGTTLKSRSKNSSAQDVQWYRSPQLGAENPDTVYLFAKINPDPNKLLFLRWKAPTFPDTYHNNGIKGKEDVRYWSMSFASSNTMTKFTIADAETVIDENGFVNLLVSFGLDRPAKVTLENGYTWVELKDKKISFLLYRNMVISPDFNFSASKVDEGEPIKDQIGDYLPRGKWVSPEDF